METTRDTGKYMHATEFSCGVLWSRHYCSRRMRRIRRSLNFTHGHRHRFQKKVLTVEKVTEIRCTTANLLQNIHKTFIVLDTASVVSNRAIFIETRQWKDSTYNQGTIAS